MISLMNNQIDWHFLFTNVRSRVYLLWAALTGLGFTATHFYQQQNINIFWFILSIVGLGYMLMVMPLRIKKLRLIFLSWLVPISIGLIYSGAVFRIPALSPYISSLGSYWLFVMAVGYFLNGLADPPTKWYWVNACINAIAGLCIVIFIDLLPYQYLMAAVISVFSMLSLWWHRTE